MTKHGQVTILNPHGYLVMRIPTLPQVPVDLRGKQYRLNQRDTPANRAQAKQIAAVVEVAILAERANLADIIRSTIETAFGRQAAPPSQPEKPISQPQLSVGDLVEAYGQHQRVAGSSMRTLVTDKSMAQHLIRLLGAKEITDVNPKDADKVYAELRKSLNDYTLRRYLRHYSTMWCWAISREELDIKNPWKPLAGSIRVARKTPKPFTRNERQKILDAFQTSPEYSHYYPLVFFMFSTGLRPNEARALLWEQVAGDFKSVRVSDSLDSFNKPKGKTKTLRSDRKLPLPQAAVSMLAEMRPKATSEIVFPSPKGLYIDQKNFAQRAWRKMLESVGVEHRGPYHIRHCALSDWMQKGMSLNDISKLGGTSLEMLSQHYIGSVEETQIPDM
jgi:integrase